MAVGDSHACAVTESGGVKCWGSNSPQGLLGNASTTAYRALAPVDVLGLNGPAVAVSVGSEHSCALLASGTVQCWGSNWWGQLGIGSTLPFSSRPLEIASNERRFVALSAQVGRSCAIDEQGGAWCWGDSWLRRLGVSTGSMTPARVVGLASGVSQLAAGGVHTCAVTASGPRCWGSNANGGLGNGSLDDLDLHTPVAVVGLPAAAVAIGVGNFFSCAALDSGAIYCWGRNNYGQLGNGLDVDYSITPVRVLGFP